MDDHADALAELAGREAGDLSAEERDALEYYYAVVNLAEGLPAESVQAQWCAMSQTVGRVAHMLGRLPVAGDPGATPEILEWIDAQRETRLSSYQRARLTSIPGGSALIE